MPKNPLKEMLGFMKTSKPNPQEKLNDFERAKEVLFSSKTPQQLISAVKYINNFNKKHGITETSPEFIYFDKMILVMKLKIKSKKVEGGEQIDEASRINRGIKNIIKSILYESLNWSDKDETFDTDKSFSNDQSWSNDSEWELNPDKSYWKQGEVGGSSGGEDVSESEDDFGWANENSFTPMEQLLNSVNEDELDIFIGKTVILSPDSEYYVYDEITNPRETEGYIESIDIINLFKITPFILPIIVKWSNGTTNSYKAKDLLIMI